MQNKIAIIGSKSFIGSAFKKNIKNKKYLYYSRSNLGDFRIYKNLNKLNKEISQIILFAYDKDSRSKISYKNNNLISNNFIDYCYNNNIKLIFISTYIPSLKKKLTYLNYYQKSKLNSENLIRKKLKNYLIIRLPNVYGEYKYKCKSINNFVDKLLYSYLSHRKIFIFNPPLYRSYIFVDEFVFFLHKLVYSSVNTSKTINLNVFKPLSNFDIIKLVEKFEKRKINLKLLQIEESPFNYYHKNLYPNEIYEIKDKLNSYLNDNLV